MTLTHTPRRALLAALAIVVWLTVALGTAAAAPRTLNPFTAIDFVSTDTGWAVHLEANVMTRDGGATWQTFSLPGDLRYDPQAVDFLNARVGYIVGIDYGSSAGSVGVVLKTTNGGKSWTVKKRFDVDLLAGVSFVNTQKGWVVGRYGCIYRTTNGGNTWKEQVAPVKGNATLYAVRFQDASHGWAVGGAGTIMRTTNGGKRWTKKTITTADLYSVDSTSSKRAWTAGSATDSSSGVVLATTNGGKTWKAQAAAGGAALPPLGGIDFWNKDKGISGGAFGSIFFTTDRGATWQPASATGAGGLGVMGVKLVNAMVGSAVCSNYTILRTDDGGATWKTVLQPTLP